MRIKICGVTIVADAVQAAELGADAIGLNFYPKSRRYISQEMAREIVQGLSPSVEPVALFVRQPFGDVIAWGKTFGLIHTFQVHDFGGLIPESPFHFIPAFPVRDRQSLDRIEAYLDQCAEGGRMPAAVLVDAHVEGEHGGTGKVAPWHLLADFRPGVPLILAGGLSPENVAEAVRLVRPDAVDVATGVESAPGKKDVEKMRRFIERAREAE